MKLDSIRNIGIGLITVFVIAVLGVFLLSNSGFFPIIDPGITENQPTTMKIKKLSKLPYASISYVNITESQINRCMILKIILQDSINSTQDLLYFQINNTEFNFINSFLDSLSPDKHINYFYYQGFFFEIGFVVS